MEATTSHAQANAAVTRLERIAFIALSAVVFIYVLVRAALIPLVHDEVTSFLAYAQTGRFLPFASMWDANNHYLNSLLGWVGYKVFGLHLLALRWASVLSFIPYAWAAAKLGEGLRSRTVRWCLWSALLMCPFLLDFFSLFRGYGPAMSCLLWALYQLVRFVQERHTRWLVHALFAVALANGFLLAFLPLWGVALLVVLPIVRAHADQRRWWFLLGALPFLAAAALAMYMARLGLLYQGTTEGFVAVSVSSLMVRMFGPEGMTVAPIVIVLIIAASSLIVSNAIRERNWRSPAILIAALFWCEVLGRIVAAKLIGLNYGEDRTALHYVLLGIPLAAFAADALTIRARWAWVLVLPLLALPMRAVFTANKDHTVLWPEQSIPDRFVHHVAQLEERLGRPAVVSTHRHAGLPWSLQRRMLGGEGDANAHSWPHGMDDARIVVPSVLEEARAGFSVVDSAPGNLLYLLLRDPPLRTATILDTSFAIIATDTKHSEALRIPADALRTSDLLVEIGGSLSAETSPLDLRLAISVLDSGGATLHSDLVFLNTRGEHWNGEQWRCIRHIPMQPSASYAEVFLWSPDSARYKLEQGRMIVRTASP